MLNIYLISEFGALLKDIPLAFDHQNVKIYPVGGPYSLLKRHENFVEITRQPDLSFIQSLLMEKDLISSMYGLVLIGSDGEMREIAESDISLEIKLKLLPIKNPEAFKILDSKVGLQEVSEGLKLSAPKGFIIKEPIDLSYSANRIQLPYFFKGDRGGGGHCVRRASLDSPNPKINDLTFPFLIQEEIIGTEVAVEAFFVKGVLRAYIYSDRIKCVTKFGPSYKRRIVQPPTVDFVSTIKSIGEFTEVEGLVNVSFIFNPSLRKHYLIEFDPRPNAWHFLAPSLGIELFSIFNSPDTKKIETANKVNFQIILLNRFIDYLSYILNPWIIVKSLFGLFTSDLVIFGGKKLSIMKIIETLLSYSLRLLVFKIIKAFFRKLPEKIKSPIKQRRLTNKVANKVLHNI